MRVSRFPAMLLMSLVCVLIGQTPVFSQRSVVKYDTTLYNK
ncbi:MAG: hypothetical protein HW374_643, partial [Bacteroidetes bacterium]|nr:hypothetical protein [Bacteroidota bacterium]